MTARLLAVAAILATVIAAAIWFTRDSDPAPITATVDASGSLFFEGDGDGQTEPLDIPTGSYFVVAACTGDGPSTFTLAGNGASELLTARPDGGVLRITRSATFAVTCSDRWVIGVTANPLP